MHNVHKSLLPPGETLRPFQTDGVRFLVLHPDDPKFPIDLAGMAFAHDKYHKLLADDMGLGKTVQAVVALNWINAKSAVIVCPAGVKIQWAREIAKWSNRPLSVYVVRTGKDNIPPGADIVVVNYELVLRHRIHQQIVARGVQRPYDAGGTYDPFRGN